MCACGTSGITGKHFAGVHNIQGAEKTNLANTYGSSREVKWECTQTPAEHNLLQKYTSKCLRIVEIGENTTIFP